MYGRTYWGAQRSTFIIDPDGTVAQVFPKVSPKTHDEVVLKALAELAARRLTVRGRTAPRCRPVRSRRRAGP